VCGIDTSAGFVAHAQQQISDPRATFRVGDALDLPFDAGAFDAVVSGLVLNHVPDPDAMVREMTRVASEGGTVAAYVWDYDAGMEQVVAFWEVAARLDAGAADFDQRGRYPICGPQALLDLFVGVGLTDVAVTAITVPTVYRDFDDYWLPFLGGQGSAPGYVRMLSEEQLTLLRDKLSARLRAEPDGSIRLHARAWAVHGTWRPP
jgi:SAM-dependent methyltransferase